MQLGIRFHDTDENLSFEERIKAIHDQGFSCTHIALSKAIKTNSVDNAALTPGYATYLRKLFAANDVDLAVLGNYLNLAHPDPDALAKITEKYLAHIRFASMLGVSVVGTETGCPNSEYKFVPECHTEEAYQIFLKNVRPVVSYAEKMGVIFAIEPVYRHIIWNPKVARRLLDDVASPNLQIILDPVNLLDMPNYMHQNEIVDEAIELLGKDVAIVHIKDYVIEDGKCKSVPVGFGQMDYKNLISYIKKEKPFVQCTLEETTPDNAVWCREHVEKIYKEV